MLPLGSKRRTFCPPPPVSNATPNILWPRRFSTLQNAPNSNLMLPPKSANLPARALAEQSREGLLYLPGAIGLGRRSYFRQLTPGSNAWFLSTEPLRLPFTFMMHLDAIAAYSSGHAVRS